MSNSEMVCAAAAHIGAVGGTANRSAGNSSISNRSCTWVAYQLRQLTAGLDQLPTESEGLRTDTMDGVLDPNETAGIAMHELATAAQLVDEAAGHARAALNKAARLYLDAESAT